MPPIIEGVDIGKKMSADEVATLHRSGKLRGITLRGFVWRHEFDGMGSWVHFTDPTANRIAPGSDGGQRTRAFSMPDPLPNMRAQVDAESPIVKRTPQERLASLTNKLTRGQSGQDAAASMMIQMLSGTQSHGSMTDEQVKAITGSSWKAGDPVDAETVRRVAAHYLGTAEQKVAETASVTNTRKGRKARREQERLEAQEQKRWAAQRRQQTG